MELDASAPLGVAGDKGSTGRQLRAALRRRGSRSTIARRRTERHTVPFDRATFRRRDLIENLFARCKQSRARATRYDKRASSFRAAWVMGMTLL